MMKISIALRRCPPKQSGGWMKMDVSENSGTPKSSIFNIGFSIINHPFWGTTIFLETPT